MSLFFLFLFQGYAIIGEENPKFEFRNSKQTRNPNFPMIETL